MNHQKFIRILLIFFLCKSLFFNTFAEACLCKESYTILIKDTLNTPHYSLFIL